MEISFVIIHELKKVKGKTGANLRLSGTTLDAGNEDVIQLITDLNNRYKYKNENYGRFDEKDQTRFYKEFSSYSKKKQEKDFIQFSQKAAEDLKIRIDGIAPAKGGYLIFSQYEHLRKYVGVFLVRNTKGLSFSEDLVQDAFDINKVVHIDFENLAMACRINLESYKTKETRYLSFIHQKSDEMSQFFTSWISADDSETNEEDTKQLYQLFNVIPTPIDTDSGTHIDRSVFLSNVHKVVTTSEGKIVNLKTLSEHFYENENYLIDYADENNFVISGEFKAHSRSLKKFIQISAKADHIELSFPHSFYKTKVMFNENNDNQIIIESEKLVAEIKKLISNSI